MLSKRTCPGRAVLQTHPPDACVDLQKTHYRVTLWDLAKMEAPSLPVYGLCKECTFYLSFYSVVVLRNYSKQWLRRDRVCFSASRRQADGIVCVCLSGVGWWAEGVV